MGLKRQKRDKDLSGKQYIYAMSRSLTDPNSHRSVGCVITVS